MMHAWSVYAYIVTTSIKKCKQCWKNYHSFVQYIHFNSTLMHACMCVYVCMHSKTWKINPNACMSLPIIICFCVEQMYTHSIEFDWNFWKYFRNFRVKHRNARFCITIQNKVFHVRIYSIAHSNAWRNERNRAKYFLIMSEILFIFSRF